MQIGFIGLGAVVETAYLPALRRLGDVIDRCQGYDLDCSRALPGIQRCSSLSAGPQIGRAVQQECRDRSRMPSSA